MSTKGLLQTAGNLKLGMYEADSLSGAQLIRESRAHWQIYPVILYHSHWNAQPAEAEHSDQRLAALHLINCGVVRHPRGSHSWWASSGVISDISYFSMTPDSQLVTAGNYSRQGGGRS